MQSARHVAQFGRTSRHSGGRLSFVSAFVHDSLDPRVGTPLAFPTVRSQKSHDLRKIKGSCITISDWVFLFLFFLAKYEIL